MTIANLDMLLHECLAQVEEEAARDAQLLHLTANETWMSTTAMRFLGTRLAERYYTGAGSEAGVVSFGPFTFLGFPGVAKLIGAAEAAAADMLGAAIVNVNCISGIHAMMCVVLAVSEPGETVMSVDPAHGGHFATSGVVERTGRRHAGVPYDPWTRSLDVERLRTDFAESGARVLYIDVSSNVDPHDLPAIREAVGPSALIVYDASHSLGLIMGGRFQDPLGEGADVVCGNTHKTLPGPQKGLIAFRDRDLGERANAVINRWLFSSTHTGSMIALAVALLEMQAHGAAYADQVIRNANALGAALDARGLAVRRARDGGWSQNHQVHVFFDGYGSSEEVAGRLAASGITTNVDCGIGDRPYLRLGTQEVTRRGMGEGEMAVVADFVHRALGVLPPAAEEVARFATAYSDAHFSLDPVGELP